jgi:hypothetical protein
MKTTNTDKNDTTSPPPRNTRNREYYSTDPTDDPDQEVEIFHMSSSSSPSPPTSAPSKHKHITTSDNPEDDLVTVSKESTPSPTASDIVLQCQDEDFSAACGFNREMQEQGVSARERKRRLVEFQKKMDAEREVRRRKELEELEKKYGDGDEAKGKGV